MRNISGFIRKWFVRIKEWMQPNAADSLPLQLTKLSGKCIALLVLVALSPILLVVLLLFLWPLFNCL